MQSAQVKTLTTASREARIETARALGSLLTFTAQLFNIGKNLNDVQVGLLANDMLERYWHWRFDEFAFVMKEAVGGRYGTSYDRLDAPTVHGWCAIYDAERSALIEAAAEKRHKANRLAEAGRESLLPDEQMPALYFRAKLEAMPDEELRRGIRYYWPQRAEAMPAKKISIAVAILRERAAWALHEATRPRTADEKESEYHAFQAAYWLEKHQQEARETGAEVIT